jgi:hypothetical protein
MSVGRPLRGHRWVGADALSPDRRRSGRRGVAYMSRMAGNQNPWRLRPCRDRWRRTFGRRDPPAGRPGLDRSDQADETDEGSGAGRDQAAPRDREAPQERRPPREREPPRSRQPPPDRGAADSSPAHRRLLGLGVLGPVLTPRGAPAGRLKCVLDRSRAFAPERVSARRGLLLVPKRTWRQRVGFGSLRRGQTKRNEPVASLAPVLRSEPVARKPHDVARRNARLTRLGLWIFRFRHIAPIPPFCRPSSPKRKMVPSVAVGSIRRPIGSSLPQLEKVASGSN